VSSVPENQCNFSLHAQ